MPETFVDHVDDSGNFTEGFSGAAKAHLGADFAETKSFDDIKSIAGLVKSYGNTKRDYGRLGKRLENAIERPGEKATDADKVKFRKGLLKELGATDDPAAFKMRPDTMPDGLEPDEEYETLMRESFVKHGVPVDIANAVAADNNAIMLARHQQRIEARATANKESWDALGVDWPGESKAANVRMAIKAMLALAVNPDEVKVLKPKTDDNPDGLDLYNDPTNIEKWQKAGISVNDIRQWHYIAQKTSAGGILPNQSTPKGGATEDAQAINAINAKSPELHVSKV